MRRSVFLVAAALTVGCSHASETEADAGATAATDAAADVHVDTGSTLPQPQMVFMSPTSGGPWPPGPQNVPWEIVVMNLDGSGRRQLTHDGKFKFLPHFSPDGSKVVYTKFSVGGYGAQGSQSDVASYDLATGVETMLTAMGDASQPTFSPDGARLAFEVGAITSGKDMPGFYLVNVDGTGLARLASAAGSPDDLGWSDPAWSRDDWLLFVVAQNVNGCFKARLDKMRSDAGARTQVTSGGAQCTAQNGSESTGDADPGWSADGGTIYTSRGFSMPPAGVDAGTERKLLAVSSDAWYAGKPETDLSLPSELDCVEGVPKGSPDGKRILLYRLCFDTGMPVGGVYVADADGSTRTFVTQGFGPDWNPAAAASP